MTHNSKKMKPLVDSAPTATFGTEISKKDREISRLSHEVTTLTLTIMHLQSDIDVRDAQLRALRGEQKLTHIDDEKQELLRLIGSLQQETELLRQQISQKDALVDALSAKIDGKAVDFVDIVKKRNTEIIELHADLTKLRADKIRAKRAQESAPYNSRPSSTPGLVRRDSIRESFGNTLEFNKLNDELCNKEQEIAQLTKDITEYKHLIEKLENESEKKTRELLEAEREAEAFKLSIEIMVHDLDKKSAEIMELTKKCSELEAELVKLSEAATSKEESSKLLETRIEELAEINSNLDLMLSQAKSDYTTLNSSMSTELTRRCDELCSLKTEVEQLKELNKSKTEEINTLHHDVNELTNTNNELKLSLNDLQSTIKFQQEDLNLAKMERNKYEEEFLVATKHIESLKLREQDIQAEVDKLTISMKKRDEQMFALQEQVATIPGLISVKDAFALDIRKTSDLLDAANSTISKLEKELEERKNKINMYKSENDSLFEEIRTQNHSIAQFQSEIKKLSDSIDRIEADVDERNQELAQKHLEIKRLGESTMKLTEDLMSKEQQMNKLELDLSTATDLASGRGAEIERLTGVVEEKEHELKKANIELQNLRSEITTLELKEQEQTDKILQLSVANTRLEEEIEERNQTLQKNEQEEASLIQKLQALETIHSEKANELVTLDQQLKHALEVKANQENELLYATQRLSSIEKENNVLSTALQESISQVSFKDEQLRDLQQTVDECTRLLSEKESEVETLSLEAKSSSGKLEDALSQNYANGLLIEELKTESATLREQISEVQQSQSKMTQQYTNMEAEFYAMQCSLKESRAELLTSTEQLTNKQHQITELDYMLTKEKTERTALEVELQRIKDDLSEAEKELEAVRSHLKESVTASDSLQIKVLHLEEECRALQKEAEICKEKLEARDSQVDNLQNDLLVAEDTVQELTNDLDEVRRQLESVLHEKQLQDGEIERMNSTLDAKNDIFKRQSMEQSLLLERLKIKESESRVPQESLIKMAFYIREKGMEISKLNKLLIEKQETIDKLLLQTKDNNPCIEMQTLSNLADDNVEVLQNSF